MATDVVRRRVEGQRRMATGVVHREWRDGSSPIFFVFFTQQSEAHRLARPNGPTNVRCEI
jgi:hypothetical protein